MRQGVLRRTGRGVYEVANAEPTEYHSIAVVTKEIPKGVVCLLSALRFHELTTQQPSECGLNDSRAGLSQPSRQFKAPARRCTPNRLDGPQRLSARAECPMKLVEGESLRVV
jgi:hypothetical protein